MESQGVKRKLSLGSSTSSTSSDDEPPAKKQEKETEPAEPAEQQNPPNTAAMERFAAMKERYAAIKKAADEGRRENAKEAALEAKRLGTSQSDLAALGRKRANAAQRLEKADAEDAGEDYERKRAWDWTAEESAAWDRRQAKKAAHRADTAFQNYGQEAHKVYKRQLKQLGDPDLEEYQAQKQAKIDKAIKEGRLRLEENEDGEVEVVDPTGTWNEGEDPWEEHYPSQERIDKLVSQLKKSEEVGKKKARKRRGKDEDNDVTYINAKNRQFNEKLARFYDKNSNAPELKEKIEMGPQKEPNPADITKDCEDFLHGKKSAESRPHNERPWKYPGYSFMGPKGETSKDQWKHGKQ